jgi:hypothetical protein
MLQIDLGNAVFSGLFRIADVDLEGAVGLDGALVWSVDLVGAVGAGLVAAKGSLDNVTSRALGAHNDDHERVRSGKSIKEGLYLLERAEALAKGGDKGGKVADGELGGGAAQNIMSHIRRIVDVKDRMGGNFHLWSMEEMVVDIIIDRGVKVLLAHWKHSSCGDWHRDRVMDHGRGWLGPSRSMLLGGWLFGCGISSCIISHD